MNAFRKYPPWPIMVVLIIILILVLLFAVFTGVKTNSNKLTAIETHNSGKGNWVELYISSQEGDRLTSKPRILFGNLTAESASLIKIDEELRYQKIEGFGATFNEAGMICLNSLDSIARDDVVRALFDTVSGAGYSLMKSPVAACDFASAGPWYSYDDTPGDTLMMNFSIKRDLGKNGLIPFIKIAKRFGSFRIESPMDFPPDWMLYSFKRGEKNVRPEYYSALAIYYSRYISEYARNGVEIDYLNPFNEPQNSWYTNESYRAIGIMVKDYIIPQFRRDGIKTRIQLCETANRPEAVRKLPDALDDPAVRKNVFSITVHGYDWDKYSTLTGLHDRYPDIPIWQTEVCYALNANMPPGGPSKVPVYDFSDGEFWGNMIMNDMKNWASAWIYWNMILDENGGPWLISIEHSDPDNNIQHPVVIIDRTTRQVVLTGLYYYLAHFSKFVRPGAFRIQSSGGMKQLNHVAFQNSDGTIILIVINNGEEVEARFLWKKTVSGFRAPAHSITTLKWNN
jgi:glucosylceramidase